MMRIIFTLCMAWIMTAGVYAQSAKKILPYDKKYEQADRYIPYQVEARVSQQLARDVTTARPSIPIGTRTSDAITVVKIGEASNAFSTLASETNPLSVLNGVGDGGSIAFVHRHNIQRCFPSQNPLDNGRMRYSISTDGGTNWNIGDGLFVSADNSAPQNQCFGIGPLTQTYTYPSRFPQAALSAPTGNTVDDLILSVTSSTLSGVGQEWNGSALITVGTAASATPSISESYDLASNDQGINGGLVERIPGEYWYVSLENQNIGADNGDGTVFVYKGTYNSETISIDWQLNNTIQPDHIVIAGVSTSGPTYITPNIAFSPNGETGYISFAGDLVGGQDTVLSPIFIESTDGGDSWGTPYEFDMNAFPEVADSLQFFVFLDTTVDDGGNIVIDTVPFSTGKATLGFDHDLVVDANGNPHFLAIVGSASLIGTPTGPVASYSIFSGLSLMLYDFTKDEFGDWNMLHVSTVNTFRALFPLGVATNADAVAIDVHTQLSRSVDGTKIFMAWTDTDTTDANYQPLPDPDGGGTMSNISPNLLTRVYDVTSNMMTPRKNWTIADQTWGGGILLPKIAPITLNESGSSEHTLATVFANIDGATSLLPTSYYYISDISIDVSQGFTEPALFFFNCKSTPYANVIDKTAPACAASDGSISLTVSGGTAPYTFSWEAIQGDSTVSIQTGTSVDALTSGIYKVAVEDANGCVDERIVNLNNQDAPAVSIASSADINCFGENNGQASITVSGGTEPLSYSWSNGETTAAATTLPKGTSTVTVRDANGCESFVSVSIDEPSAISVALNQTDVSCNGFSDGSALARVSGGTRPYSYVWSNGATTADLSSLVSGSYTVTITDANGCETSDVVAVVQPDILALTTAAQSPNLNEAAPYNGTAFASGIGGTPFIGSGLPYQYLWCNDSSGATFFNRTLPGGACLVTLVDANGCTDTATIFIQGFNPVSITDPTAGINLLEIFPNPNTGVFKLMLDLTDRDDVHVELLNMQGQLLVSRSQRQLINYDTEFNLGSAAAGVYLIRVTTSKGYATQRIVVRK